MNPGLPGRITLFIPSLFVAGEAQRWHAAVQAGVLARLLARANQTANSGLGHEHRLFSLFGIDSSSSADLPVAAVTRIIDMGVVDRDWWIRADPVHLEPSRNGLVLRTGLALSQGEADSLVAEINQALGADGWLLKAPSPERWYLKPAHAVGIATTPLKDVDGRDIQACLPRGDDSRSWHTRLNEIQILLHTSQVNAGRELRGMTTANSVWFWGGGSLPAPGSCDWTRVVANEPLVRGLARLCSVSCTNTDAGPKEALDEGRKGNVLVVLDAPLQRDSSPLARIEQEWVKPLKNAVDRGDLNELTVISDSGPVFQYRRSHRLRFWRLSRALFTHQAA